MTDEQLALLLKLDADPRVWVAHELNGHLYSLRDLGLVELDQSSLRYAGRRMAWRGRSGRTPKILARVTDEGRRQLELAHAPGSPMACPDLDC